MQVDLVLTNTLTGVRLGQLLLKPTWARLEYIIINVHFCVFAGPTFGSVHFPMAHPANPSFLYPTMLARNCKAPKAKAAPKKRNAEAEQPKAPAKKSKKSKASSSKGAEKPKGKSAKKLKKIRNSKES